MANSDYIRRNVSMPLVPRAPLIDSVAALDGTFTIGAISSSGTQSPRIGSAAMVGEEIVAILAINGNRLTVARGCGDTIPAPHAAGTAVWFFDDFVAGDAVEYAATETISVKPLPRTPTNITVPIEQSPPAQITFSSRFARPYPPGNVLVNGQSFTVGASLSNLQTSATVTWNHRDRVTQQDVLIAHGDGDIGPEAGTTYEVSIHLANGTQVAEFTGISGKTFTYNYADAITDFAAQTQSRTGFMRLRSRRSGFASWQQYEIPLIVRAGNETVEVPVTSDLELAYDIAQQPPTAVFRNLPLNWSVFVAPPPASVSASETGNFVRDPNTFEFRYDIRANGTVVSLQAVTIFRFIDSFQVTLNFIEGIHVYRIGNSIFMTGQGEALFNEDLGPVIATPAIFDFTFIPN